MVQVLLPGSGETRSETWPRRLELAFRIAGKRAKSMQNLLGHSVVAESLKHNRAKEEKEGKKAQFFF